MPSPFFSSCRRFFRDRRGVLAVVFAVGGLVCILISSLIVTYWQQINDRNELQAVADQAALAASAYLRSAVAPGAPVTDADRIEAEKEAERVIVANRHVSRESYAIAYVTEGDDAFYDVRIEASRDSFFNAFFRENRSVVVTARVEIGRSSGAEIALVLDVSGSMKDPPAGSSSRKIDLMADAAKNLIDGILLSDPENVSSSSIPNIYFSIVPYATAVRLPSDLSSRWISESAAGAVSDSAFAWSSLTSPPSWTRNGHDYAAARESVAERRAHYGHCPGYRRAPHRESDISPTTQPLPVYPGSRILRLNAPDSHYDPRLVCGGEDNAVTPLTDDRTRLFAAISALEPIGATATHQGMLWGWRSVSPNWRWSLNGQTTHDPVAYGNARNKKYIILLTDGLIYNGLPTRPPQGRPHTAAETYLRNPPPIPPASAAYPLIPSNELLTADPLDYVEEYQIDNQGRLTHQGQIAGLGRLAGSYGMLQRICRKVKESSRNIEVFTIVYDLQEPAAQAHFRNCASRGRGVNYFEATVDDLSAVFTQIAEQIRTGTIALRQ